MRFEWINVIAYMCPCDCLQRICIFSASGVSSLSRSRCNNNCITIATTSLQQQTPGCNGDLFNYNPFFGKGLSVVARYEVLFCLTIDLFLYREYSLLETREGWEDIVKKILQLHQSSKTAPGEIFKKCK